jgi:hypothetical protein
MNRNGRRNRSNLDLHRFQVPQEQRSAQRRRRCRWERAN